MKKILISGIFLLAALSSCRQARPEPRPTIPLVYSILADSTGTAGLVARAGGAEGSIAIIGEPSDAIALARRFQFSDRVDNISGTASRDSLPDFAGESFDVVLDAYFSPYSEMVSGQEGLDSLREAAVKGAVFAWDSTCYRSQTDLRPLLFKQRAKILIFTSSLHSQYGLFDVDTLQQLCGGKSHLLSSALQMIQKALDGGARSIAVWTDRNTAASGAWEAVFNRFAGADASLEVLFTDQAVDIRTEFRDLLRQYRSSGKSMDALILDSYSADPSLLESELSIIRLAGIEEDRVFDNLLSPSFTVIDPLSTLVENTYRLLREEHLFTHRIALPAVKYYETEPAGDGEPILVEAAASYIQKAYVSDIH